MAPRVQPVDETTVDETTRRIFADAERRGAPNSTLLRILTRHPLSLRAFYDGWQDTFYGGQVPHTLKELMRVRMARLRNCGYWGGVRSAVAEEQGIDRRKVEATWDPDDPIFTPKERAALEMATLFSEDYHAISDEHVARWREFFSEEELIELGAFMAFADGFGKLVEMLGLGAMDQACEVEI